MSKYGLIPAKYFKVFDYHFGGISGITGEVLNPSGDWTSYLPVKEYQYGTFLDSMGCVTFSAMNCLEILFKRQYNVVYNFSDRFTAKLSDTTKNGNYLYKVGDAIRQYGLIEEQNWPFDRSMFDWDIYYADIPTPLIADGKTFLAYTTVQYEFVSPNNTSLLNALQEAPLQVTITYPNNNQGGVFQRQEGQEQHAVTLIKGLEGEPWEIFDTYNDTIKRLAWDYKFFTALKYNLSLKKLMAIPSNTLIQLIEGAGNFGLLVGDKLYVDDLAKITASWLVRNNGKVDGKVRAVKTADFNSWKHYNLKGEPTN